jgi:hypothetical protein
MATVRDFVDDAAAWQRLSRFAVANGLASSDTQLARLVAPFLDRPVAEIGDGVWTRIWPARATLRDLADLVADAAEARQATPAAAAPGHGQGVVVDV